MAGFRFLSAGESHGKGLVAVVEGIPSGLSLTEDDVNVELARRQRGYGRGGRMQIERDRVEFISGLRKGVTLGSPISMIIRNRDWENWKDLMSLEPGEVPEPAVVRTPRPGHADLVGALKYGHSDIRNILERASARETAARVAVGAIAKRFLGEFGIRVISHVVEIGGVKARDLPRDPQEVFRKAEESEVRCADHKASEMMMQAIDIARDKGDTLGGVVEVMATGVPVGLGSHVHWDRRLDGRLAMAMMSIPGVKGVEIGLGFRVADYRGSQVHDEIYYEGGFRRRTNHAGGLEGGITTGEAIVLRAAMKPLSSLGVPLGSVDIRTKEMASAHRERSDVCAVPACGVVGEAMVAIELCLAFLDKFGGDSLDEVKRNFDGYVEALGRV